MSATFGDLAKGRLGRARPTAIAEGQPLPTSTGWTGTAAIPVPCVTPRLEGTSLATWSRQVSSTTGPVAALLAECGVVLLRGFAVGGVDDFASTVTHLLGGDLEPYTFRSTPRQHLGEHVYTSTEYPAAEQIPLHSECSYSPSFPRHLAFRCRAPADEGGSTTLVRTDRVWAELPAAVRARFAARGVTYRRTYGDALGLSWKETFQAEDRNEAALRCRQLGIDARWRGDVLHTTHAAPAWIRHPDHGPVWFNQANLFHVSSLGLEVEQELRAQYATEDLPRHSTFADGSEIEPEDLAAVGDVIDALAWDVPWQADDVLIVDNMLVGHGRRPFRGPRRVEVAMCGVVERRDDDPTAVADAETR